MTALKAELTKSVNEAAQAYSEPCTATVEGAKCTEGMVLVRTGNAYKHFDQSDYTLLDCPECKGSGRIHPYPDAHAWLAKQRDTCPRCFGAKRYWTANKPHVDPCDVCHGEGSTPREALYRRVFVERTAIPGGDVYKIEPVLTAYDALAMYEALYGWQCGKTYDGDIGAMKALHWARHFTPEVHNGWYPDKELNAPDAGSLVTLVAANNNTAKVATL